jgi:hypothetical protein
MPQPGGNSSVSPLPFNWEASGPAFIRAGMLIKGLPRLVRLVDRYTLLRLSHFDQPRITNLAYSGHALTDSPVTLESVKIRFRESLSLLACHCGLPTQLYSVSPAATKANLFVQVLV